MIIYFKKHPNPQTLAIISNVAQDGYEEISKDEFEVWRHTELATGWTPTFLEESNQDRMARLAIICEAYSQGRLDNLAQSWGYNGIVSLVSYKGDSNPRFNTEGSAGFIARSAEWTAADNFRGDVVNGKIAPTFENYVASLPILPDKPII